MRHWTSYRVKEMNKKAACGILFNNTNRNKINIALIKDMYTSMSKRLKKKEWK